jgi:para-nitrobenzyl esterase
MAMPGARGLFHKAVIQSGPGLTGKPIAAADKVARQLLDDLKVKTPADLAALSAEAISLASVKVPGEVMRLYTPVVDGTALPRDPFEPDAAPLNADVPVLIGTNKDESTLFMLGHPKFGAFDEADLAKHAASAAKDKAEPLIAALRAAYPDYSPTHLASGVGTAVGMWAGSLKLAERKAAQKAAPVWMYMLTWETPVAKGRLRSPHALEIPLVFDNVEKARSFVGRGDEPRAVADQMSAAWLAFAHTGDPGWPAYDTKTRTTKWFDVESRIVNDPLPDVRKVLEN